MDACVRQISRLGVAVVLLFSAGHAMAHPALYHYLEIYLHKPGEVRVFVTLHAPELSPDVAPLEEDVFGAEWLSTRDDETIAELVAEARRFVDEVFVLRIGERQLVLDAEFPDAETIRHPGPDSEVPAGCFSGEAALVYQVGDEALRLDFSVSAEKRLMLVVNRPAAFPEVVDLEPGESRTMWLLPAPVSKPALFAPINISEGDLWAALMVVGALVILFVVTLIRRRRACARWRKLSD